MKYDIPTDVAVIGAGLAGCEAAWQVAQRGFKVTLFEMKPEKKSPAHKSSAFCELVCSNSLRAEGSKNAIGLLKEELRYLKSIIMQCADTTRVPAGGALAVDRDAFSNMVTEKIKSHPNINVVNREVTDLDFDCNTIVATGPLTSDALSDSIRDFFGLDYLYFFDAAAPVVTAESIDMSKAYFASRYDKGTPDYINCPMDEADYDLFYNSLISAETAKLKDFENDRVFEGCMPVEVMAKRGYETLLFGPLKPVGLRNPYNGNIPKAVVQLRKDNAISSLYNIVGFQTHLTFGEQKRVFSLIPGLQNSEFVRYGVMHRNTYINSPKALTCTYETRKRKGLFFAGQMTGVEGYIESVSSGFVAALNALPNRQKPLIFDRKTAIGALSHYISNDNIENFQPMNVNFGLFPPLDEKTKKKDKKEAVSERALKIITDMNLE
ncbi:MAG: methylenetetrahydrofolate--tRNA-((54)-C(5))-methyltransferase ((2)-oxidizing) TrmFO [Clostridia bacterium]|nr:methylenetetrahydrofolate--tRNA-((54)-C(5))-methyltransferase ((2)-oxidizing) TrmFO [Clostridia bacterium]